MLELGVTSSSDARARDGVYRSAALIFLAYAVATAAWLGLNLWLPVLRESGLQSNVERLVIYAVVLGGLWLGLTRTTLDGRTRVTAWLTIAVPYTLWMVGIWWLAAAGTFRAGPGGAARALPVAIFLPVLIGLPLLLRSGTIARLLDAMPSWWLVALQAYRVLGGIFLVGWLHGDLSTAFALPAGTGDTLVGLLALPTAFILATGAASGRRLAIAWNVLGICDLVLAISMGMLTAPGALQVIVPDVQGGQLGTFPTVMIPAFAVPSSLLLHALSLRQLARLGRRSAQGEASVGRPPAAGTR